MNEATCVSLPRTSGVLLHPTQLPGPFGRGDLGEEARAFVDQLASAGCGLWQVLPLGPPGYGGSPYAARSAFAGDAALVDLRALRERGLLTSADLADPPGAADADAVDPSAEAWRLARLERAWTAFARDASADERAELAAFRARARPWLEPYARFEALKGMHGGRAFWEWERGLARGWEPALAAAEPQLSERADAVVFAQWCFERDWQALRAYAAERGLQIMGDLPIFLARDSADVWANPALFELDERGEPSVVAGVPPDDFCEDGQLWGNPLYDWKVHARTGYAWWIARVARAFELCDWVRIDHFRGFAGYWEIPACAATAREGRWVDGPRASLFEALAEGLRAGRPEAEAAPLRLVAEDLGVITDDVTELLAQTGFPGMRVLQFAYYDDCAEHPFRPENHPEHAVVYTGTHDNQTTRGWFDGLDAETRARAALDPQDPVSDLVRRALESKAALAILPAQDLLGLGDEARTNTPGVAEGNWTWRLRAGQLDAEALGRLREANAAAGRRALRPEAALAGEPEPSAGSA